MSHQEVRLGDTGTKLRVALLDGETPVDLSALVVGKLKLRKPDGTVIERVATVVPPPSSGVLEYTTIAGDLDQVGQWEIQAYIEVGTGQWHSTREIFVVSPRL
ncbi:MAG TPA: hypothetical protein VNI83_04690 [Vicinamibacterales bacterium]|nr:hypothetical protein [Vicinamibacterales bacterium]